MKSAEGLKKWGLVCLALPFLAMGFMFVTNHQATQGTEYRLSIEGYDPRDLLRGHYLIFRYKWPESAINMFADNTYPRTKDVCACFSGNPEVPDVRFDACHSTHSAQKDCKARVKVSGTAHINGFQPDQTLRQFYIPEKYALDLENMLRSGKHTFEVGLVPGRDGRAKLKTLYIDNIPLDKFLSGDFEAYTISR